MPLYDFTDPTNALIDPFKKFPHLAPNLHAAAQNGSLLQTPLTHFSHVPRAEDIGSFGKTTEKPSPICIYRLRSTKFCLCFDVCKKPLKMRQNKAVPSNHALEWKPSSYLLSSAFAAFVSFESTTDSASMLTVSAEVTYDLAGSTNGSLVQRDWNHVFSGVSRFFGHLEKHWGIRPKAKSRPKLHLINHHELVWGHHILNWPVT